MKAEEGDPADLAEDGRQRGRCCPSTTIFIAIVVISVIGGQSYLFLILALQSVSYSTTAAIVYAVSSVFFFFLVLFLFVVGLTPMTPCFRQCFQLSIIQHLLTLIQANHPQNILIVRINVIISSCTKCLKKRWVTTPEEKIDWGVKELEDRSQFHNFLLLFHNYVCPHHFLSELLESCFFVATRRKATLHPELAD